MLSVSRDRVVRAAAALMAAMVLLAACSSDAKPTSAPSAPSGYRWQPVKKVAASFAAPSSWNAIEATEAQKLATDSPEWGELARRSGLESQDLERFLDQVDVYLVGEPVDGFAPNIGVALLPIAELPTDMVINQQIAPISSAPPDIKRFKSEVGAAIRVSFPSTGADSRSYATRALYFAMDPGVLAINVTTADERTADELAQVVSRTLHLD